MNVRLMDELDGINNPEAELRGIKMNISFRPEAAHTRQPKI